VLLGTLELVLLLPGLRKLAVPAAGTESVPGRSRWITLLVSTTIPALSYYPLTGLGALFSANTLFPQGITNQILIWAVGNGLIALMLGGLLGRKRSTVGADSKLFARLPLAALAAVLSVLGLYIAVAVSDGLFKSDLRFWVVALKLPAPHHIPIICAYVLPFVLFFVASQWAWLRGLPLRAGAVSQYVGTIAANVLGLLVMVAGAYAWLFATGHLPPVDPLFTIVAIQFVPVLTLTSIVCVFAWRRTGRIEVGAMICGAFVTWYVVAGQATHV